MKYTLILLFLFLVPSLFAQDLTVNASAVPATTSVPFVHLRPDSRLYRLKAKGEVKDTRPLISLVVGDYASPWEVQDNNGDGQADYVVLRRLRNDNKPPVLEAELYDYNFDGLIDDFCYYLDNQPVYREIDSNFDGKIDVWLQIIKGNRLKAYEKDSNFDGILDAVKQFGN